MFRTSPETNHSVLSVRLSPPNKSKIWTACCGRVISRKCPQSPQFLHPGSDLFEAFARRRVRGVQAHGLQAGGVDSLMRVSGRDHFPPSPFSQ